MIGITPLESWIREKACIGRHMTGGGFDEALKTYQLRKVNEIVGYSRRYSPFYRRHLASFPVSPLSSLSDITRIPFTAPSDITNDPTSFLAVRQDDIARIVTLRTSGSTGESKRLFFTEEDLGLTVDFFHHGMSTFVQPGQKVAVLLPGETPDSVGDLLVRGLQRMNVHGTVFGPVANPLHTAKAIASFGAQCIVGIPTQVLAMARSRAGAALGKGHIESVLLSTDYVPRAIAEILEKIWGCRVFTHYGMTEMGLGGGVECEALDGYHLREADLYFEVVDPETGEACPDGTIGEVVFTTLTRRGMPLLRYKTGDIARIIPQPCPCGSALRRMERVRGRWCGTVRLGPECTLSLPDIDEVLFRLPDLLDYRITVAKGNGGRCQLHIDVQRAEGGSLTDHKVLTMLTKVESLQKSIAMANLETPSVRFVGEGCWTTNGVEKRQIITIADKVFPTKS